VVVVVAEEAVVVAEVAEVVVVAEEEVAEVAVVAVVEPVVVVVLRRNNADPNRCRQCLANRLCPNQRPKSEELWSIHRSRPKECGQYLRTTGPQR
jgi:hypothetical protein